MECFIDVTPLIKSISHMHIMCWLSWNTFEFTALFLWDNMAIFYITNRTIYECLEIWNLFLVLNRISHSFALLTLEISWSTFEINFTIPHIHVLSSIYTLFLLIRLLSLIFQLNFLTETKMMNGLKFKTRDWPRLYTTSPFYKRRHQEHFNVLKTT